MTPRARLSLALAFVLCLGGGCGERSSRDATTTRPPALSGRPAGSAPAPTAGSDPPAASASRAVSDAELASAEPAVLAEVEWHGDLVVDEAFVYYRSGAAIWRVPVGGGAPQAIVRRDGARPFAVDDERLYFTVDFQALTEIAKSGGATRPVANLGGRVWRLGFDGAAVYAAPWMQNGGAIVRIDRRTGSATTLVADAGNVHAGVSVDGSHIYWTANAEVRRCAKAGGEAEVVGSGPVSYTHLTLPTILRV